MRVPETTGWAQRCAMARAQWPPPVLLAGVLHPFEHLKVPRHSLKIRDSETFFDHILCPSFLALCQGKHILQEKCLISCVNVLIPHTNHLCSDITCLAK